MSETKPKRISTLLLVVAIIVALIIGVIAGYFIGSTVTPTRGLTGTYTIAYIQCDPVESDYDWRGVELGIEDVNKWLESINAPYRFKVLKSVSDGTAVKTQELFSSSVAAGAQVVIGVSWSSHARAILESANSKKVPIISIYSTSALLAIPNDYLFRIVPTTSVYGKFIKQYMQKRGLLAAIIVFATEPFGTSYKDGVEKELSSAGIDVIATIPVNPESAEWTPEYGLVRDAYVKAVSKYGEGKVLIIDAISSDKCSQAQIALSRYPELLSAEVLLSNAPDNAWLTDIPEICVKTKAWTFQMTHPDNPVQRIFKEEYKKKYGEDVRYPHELQAYDCVWIAAYAIAAAGEYKGEEIAKWIPKIASNYFGATGYCKLDENGDRMYADQTLLRIVKEDGKYVFKTIGYYNAVTDTLTLLEE